MSAPGRHREREATGQQVAHLDLMTGTIARLLTLSSILFFPTNKLALSFTMSFRLRVTVLGCSFAEPDESNGRALE